MIRARGAERFPLIRGIPTAIRFRYCGPKYQAKQRYEEYRILNRGPLSDPAIARPVKGGVG